MRDCSVSFNVSKLWQDLEVPSLNREQTYNGGDVERDVGVRVEVGLALGKARHKAGHVCAGLEAVNEHNLHRPEHSELKRKRVPWAKCLTRLLEAT